MKAFGYPLGTALAVGLNLSQIGEFVFVLLSVANQQSLLPESVYMLLMGERKPHCFFLGYNTMCGGAQGELISQLISSEGLVVVCARYGARLGRFCWPFVHARQPA